MESAPVMLWRGAADGAITFVNRAWLSFHARPLASALGRGWLEGVFDADRRVVIEAVGRACRDRRTLDVEYRVPRQDGSLRQVAMNGTPIVDESGAFHGHVGSCTDITDHRHDASSHPLALSRLEALIRDARDMAYRLRLAPERSVEYAIGAVEAITGHPAAAFMADASLLGRAVHPDDAAAWRQGLERPHRLAEHDIVIRWVHPDGRVVWAEHHRRPVLDASGRLVAVEGIARDITHLVASQQQLRASEDQMRQLAARLQAAREEERGQVARELHDELGQTLTALKLEIGRAIAALNLHQLPPPVIDRMQSLMGLSEIAIATVKRIATNLRPPALDHLGLIEAIRWEALAFKARSGIRCHIRAKKKDTRLSREQQTAAFRIFQEALTNVARHAGASAVTVAITEADVFELRIRDNGKGINDKDADNPASIGLVGMRERAALVGGTFQIRGRRGQGTTVSVQIPIEASPVRPAARPRRKATPRIRR
jgi:two-component system, NarL family, sensor histidine kinase UhpB